MAALRLPEVFVTRLRRVQARLDGEAFDTFARPGPWPSVAGAGDTALACERLASAAGVADEIPARARARAASR